MKKNQEAQNAADLQEMAVRLTEAKRQLRRVWTLARRYESLNQAADRNFTLDVMALNERVDTALQGYFPADMLEELECL